MLEQLTTEELKAELEARQKVENPFSETGFCTSNNLSYYGLRKDGTFTAVFNDGLVLPSQTGFVGVGKTPCTREDFMAALENNFTKIREALDANN
jgi:hypothetical protein